MNYVGRVPTKQWYTNTEYLPALHQPFEKLKKRSESAMAHMTFLQGDCKANQWGQKDAVLVSRANQIVKQQRC